MVCLVSRDDDRFLLQACLQGDPTEGSTDTLNVIANHLNRSLDEVSKQQLLLDTVVCCCCLLLLLLVIVVVYYCRSD